MTVWILTSSYNDYDQHGEYFVEAFDHKPSIEELSCFTGLDPEFYMPTLEKLLEGGGRMGVEYKWFYLDERKCK